MPFNCYTIEWEEDGWWIMVALYVIRPHNPAYRARGENIEYEDKAQVRHKGKDFLGS